MELTVIIPAHNPRIDYLQRALEHLRLQTIRNSRWELLVVDNRSDNPLLERVDLAWHPEAYVIREDELGLTRARLAGLKRARGKVIVFCDDDNLFASDYLENVLLIVALSSSRLITGSPSGAR